MKPAMLNLMEMSEDDPLVALVTDFERMEKDREHAENLRLEAVEEAEKKTQKALTLDHKYACLRYEF